MKETFEEKELQILRKAIDNATSISGRKLVQSDAIKKIIEILENFLRTHKTLCYGGTAINNILPEQYRFYNKDIEIPDYDFFSPLAMEYARDLANIYYKAGYEEVEAKSGMNVLRGPKFAEVGIVTRPVYNATIGEAGKEAVLPLNEFYSRVDNTKMVALLEKLIATVEKGGNVYMDGTLVGNTTVMANSKMG